METSIEPLEPTAREMQAEPKPRRLVARAYYLVLALIILAGLILGLGLSIAAPTLAVVPNPATAGTIAVIIGFFSFFTILSNVITMCVAFTLVRNPNRRGPVFDVLFFDALLMMTITGLVFTFVLAPMLHMVGLGLLMNSLLHFIAPPMIVLGWAVFGPRPRFSFKLIGLSLIIPALWIVYTLIHGALINWYPYPFVNVTHLGYAQVAINLVAILVGSLIIGAIYLGIGSLIARSRNSKEKAVPPANPTATTGIEDESTGGTIDAQKSDGLAHRKMEEELVSH